MSRKTIVDLVADMNRVGFGVLPGYLQPDDLEELRQFVETAVASTGGEYVVFTGEEAVAGTLLARLSSSPAEAPQQPGVAPAQCAQFTGGSAGTGQIPDALVRRPLPSHPEATVENVCLDCSGIRGNLFRPA